MVACIVWKILNKRKRQPWIVAVYQSLEWQMYYNSWKHIQCEDQAVGCRFWSLHRKMYAKYVNNQQREVLAVYDAINKISVVKSSMNSTYLSVGWSQRCNVCLYCWKVCDNVKQQPCIVAVYRSLEQQVYCKYLNNIQCEGPAVRCRFWSLQRKMYAKYVKNQQR